MLSATTTTGCLRQTQLTELVHDGATFAGALLSAARAFPG